MGWGLVMKSEGLGVMSDGLGGIGVGVLGLMRANGRGKW